MQVACRCLGTNKEQMRALRRLPRALAKSLTVLDLTLARGGNPDCK